MKILYLITRPDRAGAQMNALELARAYHKTDEVALGVGGEGFLAEAARQEGIPVHILPNLVRAPNPLADTRCILDVARLLKQQRFDLLHAHSAKAGIVGRLGARLAGVPSIFTAHGWSFAPNTPAAQKMYALPTEKLAAAVGRHVVTVSNVDRDLALRRRICPPSKMTTIYYGFPDNPTRAQPGTPAEEVRVTMVARMEDQKDPATLIRAVQGLCGCRVLFVGDGPNTPKMEALSRDLGTNGQVEFLRERSDVLELLAGSHIFALSTNWEGLPISIQEAMRAGLPVVATDVDGIKEEVIDGETGRLVPHKDPEALRAALLELMGDPELRARMGRAGRARWEQEFSLEAMLAKTDVVYRGGSLGR